MGIALLRMLWSAAIICGLSLGSQALTARETSPDPGISDLPSGVDEEWDGGVEAASQGELRLFRVTAYCDRGITASGIPSGVGQCAGPEDLPFGTRIYVPALERTFIVTDRTHRRFRQNTVDLFIPNYGACRQFGRHYLECQITRPEKPFRYGSNSLASAVGEVQPRGPIVPAVRRDYSR